MVWLKMHVLVITNWCFDSSSKISCGVKLTNRRLELQSSIWLPRRHPLHLPIWKSSDEHIRSMWYGACSSLEKKKFQHKTAHNKVWGLYSVSWSWFLERAIPFELYLREGRHLYGQCLQLRLLHGVPCGRSLLKLYCRYIRTELDKYDTKQQLNEP